MLKWNVALLSVKPMAHLLIYSMYRHVFFQKYMHIHAYTDIRPPHHSVGICKYVLEIHACTAADKAKIYCSLEVIYVHICTLHVSIWYVLRRISAVYVCIYDSHTCIYISCYVGSLMLNELESGWDAKTAKQNPCFHAIYMVTEQTWSTIGTWTHSEYMLANSIQTHANACERSSFLPASIEMESAVLLEGCELTQIPIIQ